MKIYMFSNARMKVYYFLLKRYLEYTVIFNQILFFILILCMSSKTEDELLCKHKIEYFGQEFFPYLYLYQ